MSKQSHENGAVRVDNQDANEEDEHGRPLPQAKAVIRHGGRGRGLISIPVRSVLFVVGRVAAAQQR